MGLVGLFAFLYRDRREQGIELKAHRPTLERDLIFFLGFFALALALAWGAPAALRIPLGIAAMLAYPLYIRRTLRGGGAVQGEETLQPLFFERRPEHRRNPTLWLCVVQLLVGLGAMVGGAHLFVEHLLSIADSLGVEAVVLALSSPRWRPSCRRRSTASSGFATARTRWRSATSPVRWSSSRRSRSGSVSSLPTGT